LPSTQFLVLFDPDFLIAPNKHMAGSKKRVIKSLESLSDDLRELMRQQFPNGYEASITRISNAKKEPIFVFPLETDDAIYLVKVPATRNSEGEYDVESGKKQEFDAPEDDDLSADADFEGPPGGDGYEEEDERGGKSREASYDPDFDN
jgi:hypothetical protein